MTTTPLRRSYDTLINKIFRSWIENKVSKTRNLRLFLFEGTVLNYSSFACTMPEISISFFFLFALFVSRTWWYSLYNPEWLSHKKSNLLCRSLLYSASTEVEIFSSFKSSQNNLFAFILKKEHSQDDISLTGVSDKQKYHKIENISRNFQHFFTRLMFQLFIVHCFRIFPLKRRR